MSAENIKIIRENIGRAKGCLKRDKFIPSIAAAIRAFKSRDGLKLIGKDKYEIEFMLVEYCDEFSKHVKILQILDKMKIRRKPFVAYQPGLEQAIAGRLDIVKTRLEDMEREAEERAVSAKEQQKKRLLREGQDLLNKGEFPRGKAYLRRAVDDFGGEPGLMTDVGRRLVAAELFTEAKDILKQSVANFPNDHKAYQYLVAAYKGLGEYDNAEDVYLAALKQFGNHPVTCLNLSKLYLEQRKRDKAYDYAKMALQADPSLAEAQEVMRKAG